MPEKTKYKANLYVTNKCKTNAFVEVEHQYGDHDSSRGFNELSSGKSMGPIEIEFNEGLNDWCVVLKIPDGDTEGYYESVPRKFTCKLTGGRDSGKRIDMYVDEQNVTIDKPSGKFSTGMRRMGPYIAHIFVLMLENRSFDHIFGYSGLTGIDPDTRQKTTIRGLDHTESNIHDGSTYMVGKGAVDPMTTDPGHEFEDTLEQLCGAGTAWNKDLPYPAIDMSGFAANYATTTREKTGIPTVQHRGDVMACCEPSQVAALHKLAEEFAVCDNWFSSMPGPTWPNRFFAMGGSSGGLDDSPSEWNVKLGESISGFKLPNGSIFQNFINKGLYYRLYQDTDNEFAPTKQGRGGMFMIAAALKGHGMGQRWYFHDFAKHLNEKTYTPSFIFIEPNYGDAEADTFVGGSSQHPMDSLIAGDKLVAATYNAIRSSPVWKHSVLIITYDEHGGFYDHVPPPAAPVPGGAADPKLNKHGFDFSRYGVRVPAVVVSPYIPKGTIDHTLFDHTTIIKTACEVFGLPHLTERDKNANSLRHIFYGAYRDDCPLTVTPAAAPAPVAARGVKGSVPFKGPADDEPLPEKGNIIGFLQIAAKVDYELSDGSEAAKALIIARLETIETYGQAREYIDEVGAKLKAYEEITRVKEDL